MQFSDLQKEFERIRGLLEAGGAKLGKEDYRGACQDFEECLEILEQGHPQDHPDRIACLKGLGDTYFALHRDGEARQIFHELLKISDLSPESSVDGLITRFKLAKSAERAGAAEEAMALYEQLTTLAEQSLVEGHPFFSTILESHAGLLSRAGLKKKAAALTKRARANRNKYSKKGSLSTNVLSGLSREAENAANGQGDDALKVESEISMYSSESMIPLKDRKQLMLTSEGHQRWRQIALGLMTLLLFSAVAGALYVTQHFVEQESTPAAGSAARSPQIAENFQSQKYVSLDGQESLELVDRVTARLTASGESRTVGWCKGGSLLASLHKMDGLVFADHGDVLTEANGLNLYRDGAAELKVVKNMRALADVADKAYQQDQQYPEEIERVFSVGPGEFEYNPVNNSLVPIKIIYLGHDKEWNPDSTSQEPAVLAQLRQAAPAAFADDLIPGCTYGYYLLSGNADAGLTVKAFFVRGCDRQGRLIQSGTTGKNLIYCRLNGHDPVSAGEKANGAETNSWTGAVKKGFVVIDKSVAK